ncbi:Rdx family-domain-containing protein [Schizothecium vesticola]|uniref:Rdx family-domain-containing protein n=1 Tax=Schizothecium vesticola TaxID=314040 RepID=A0AA40BQG6_9PEZI|nr:Rdx family-domain-containing protein [Schizothecium vesticola]
MASPSNDVGASSSHTSPPAPAVVTATGNILLPRVTIQFCTQCKWLLRAAYYAQELLSTFSNSLAEVSLQPSLGGIFRVELITATTITIDAFSTPNTFETTTTTRLWDRKSDGGFPETKELKRRVRDVIQPGRSLGHVDRTYPRAEAGAEGSGGGESGAGAVEDGKTKGAGEACTTAGATGTAGGEKCEDCE